MFGIEWLRNGVPVDKETSILASAAEAIVAAKSRRQLVADRHPEREPDKLSCDRCDREDSRSFPAFLDPFSANRSSG